MGASGACGCCRIPRASISFIVPPNVTRLICPDSAGRYCLSSAEPASRPVRRDVNQRVARRK